MQINIYFIAGAILAFAYGWYRYANWYGLFTTNKNFNGFHRGRAITQGFSYMLRFMAAYAIIFYIIPAIWMKVHFTH